MSPVLSQAVDLRFFCGTEHTAMNYASFKKLPPKLQDMVLETAFDAQQYTQKKQERALVEVVGAVPNPKPDTLFAQERRARRDAVGRRAEEGRDRCARRSSSPSPGKSGASA